MQLRTEGGVELLSATIRLRNTNSLPSEPGHATWVSYQITTILAEHPTNHVSPSTNYGPVPILPGQSHDGWLIVPEGAQAFRVQVKHAPAVRRGGALTVINKRLSRTLEPYVPRGWRRALIYRSYGPSRDEREFTREFLLPAPHPDSVPGP